MDTRVVALTGGINLTVEEAGEGPALLMMHSGVAERHMWDRQWEWLQNGWRVIRWDWRGFGDTPHVPGPFSYTDDVIRVMDALEIRQATLMSCSFAGSVAIQVALQHPERVERLILVSSGVPGHTFPNPPKVEAIFAKADEAFSRDDAEEALSLMEQVWLIGPDRRADEVDPLYLNRARALLKRADQPDNGAQSQDAAWSAQGRLSEIRVPVLIIVGDKDVPGIVAAASFLADEIPHARLEVIENAAHSPNMERPRQFDAILADWLAETAGPGPAREL